MKPRILVVEDELDMFKALAIRLDANGFDTQLATSVATSVAMVRIDPPDLIVLDLGLPDGDGYTVMDKYLDGLDPTKKIDWSDPKSNISALK